MFGDCIMGAGLALTVSTGKAVIEDGFVIEITSRVRQLGKRVEITNVTRSRLWRRFVVETSPHRSLVIGQNM
jgi:hypothetical protein